MRVGQQRSVSAATTALPRTAASILRVELTRLVVAEVDVLRRT
jgi:hypothetical protein